MAKLRAIALTAFQETLRRRVFYIVLVLAVIVVTGISSEMFFMRMAQRAGETKMLTTMVAQLVRGILQIWNTAALFLALFLGAIAISSEISGRTIVHVMSRPVERVVYLLGRWLGVLLFLWGFLAIGIAGALLVALWWHVSLSSLLWLGVAEMCVTVTFFSGVALGLSVFLPPVLAGGATFLLAMLPAMVGSITRDPRWLHRLPGLLGYYIGPAQMPVNLLGASFAKADLHSDVWLYVRVLAENVFYAVVVLIIASAIFRRREIRVR